MVKGQPLRLQRKQVTPEVQSLSKTKAAAPSSGKYWSWLTSSFYLCHSLFYCCGFVSKKRSHIFGTLKKVLSPVGQFVSRFPKILDQIILIALPFFYLYQVPPQLHANVQTDCIHVVSWGVITGRLLFIPWRTCFDFEMIANSLVNCLSFCSATQIVWVTRV